MATDPELLYRQLGQLVAEMPNLASGEPLTPQDHRWLARAGVLVGEVSPGDAISFKSSINFLEGLMRSSSAHQITAIVYRALALAESKAPPGIEGAFIAAGAGFDALQAISKVLSQAEQEVMIVDPYMDAKVLTDFAPLCQEGVTVLLLSDPFYTKPEAVMPPAERWVKQYGTARPLQIRMTAPRALHDRLVLLDRKSVWILTQSLKDFAGRSPATVQRVDAETAKLKIPAYEEMWGSANVLI